MYSNLFSQYNTRNRTMLLVGRSSSFTIIKQITPKNYSLFTDYIPYNFKKETLHKNKNYSTVHDTHDQPHAKIVIKSSGGIFIENPVLHQIFSNA